MITRQTGPSRIGQNSVVATPALRSAKYWQTRLSHNPCCLLAQALLVVIIFAFTGSSQAATAKESALLRKVGVDLSRASKLTQDGKHREAAKKIPDILTGINLLAAVKDAAFRRRLKLLKTKLQSVHTLIALEGIAVPPLKFDEPAPDKPTPAKPTPGDGKISFASQIAPLLVAKCGRCHIDDTKGKLSMATFAALRRGSEAGVVIMPGNSKGSRMIELIVEGDMPRGGGKISKEQLALLSKWIDEGARCDAPSVTTPLKQLTAAAKPDEPKEKMLQVVKATGNESSSYSRDVAQVVARACMNCHGARQPRANFSMLTFERLLRGGDSGAVIVPGKPGESLLIKKLKGMAGARMPLRMPALAEKTINRIEQWIADGARYDGGDPKIETPRLAAMYVARNSTHEQLSTSRGKLAVVNWRLALPGDENKPNILETDDFLLYGTVSMADLKSIAAVATEQAAKVAGALKGDLERPLVKGRITLYVFRQRYDYSEFGQMAERRQLPKDWRGHWGYTTTDAYLCIVPPRQDEYSLKGLLAQQLAGVYVASQGADVPRWFAEGSARVVAAKLEPRDQRIRQWGKRLPRVLADSPKPDAFLTGGLPPEEADIAAYGFVKAMKPTSRKYQKLLDILRKGNSFEQAFVEVYRRKPVDLARSWANTSIGR